MTTTPVTIRKPVPSDAPAVAEAVARKAIETGEARVHADPSEIADRVRQFIYEE